MDTACAANRYAIALRPDEPGVEHATNEYVTDPNATSIARAPGDPWTDEYAIGGHAYRIAGALPAWGDSEYASGIRSVRTRIGAPDPRR